MLSLICIHHSRKHLESFTGSDQKHVFAFFVGSESKTTKNRVSFFVLKTIRLSLVVSRSALALHHKCSGLPFLLPRQSQKLSEYEIRDETDACRSLNPRNSVSSSKLILKQKALLFVSLSLTLSHCKKHIIQSILCTTSQYSHTLIWVCVKRPAVTAGMYHFGRERKWGCGQKTTRTRDAEMRKTRNREKDERDCKTSIRISVLGSLSFYVHHLLF